MTGDGAKSKRWGWTVGLGVLAGLLPIPLTLVGTLVWAEAVGAGDAEAQLILVRMGLILGLAGGALFALLGGWWVGRIARTARVAHGAVLGMAAGVVGAAVAVGLGAPVTLPMVAAWLIRPPSGAFGGWLADRRRQREPGPEVAPA